MSLVPAFELGWWNAWMLIIPLLVLWIGGIKFLFSKRMPDAPLSPRKKDKILTNLLVILMFGSFVYSVFMPLGLGTLWFSLGLVVYLIGLILILVTMIAFATTPLDKPVTNGAYRYSRNPMFIGFFLLYGGISIACVSWVYLVLTVVFIAIVTSISPLEEAITLGHYGKAYKEYMERTPRWLGIPKK